MGSLSAWHWLVVLVVVVLLFGSSKLPQVARSLGQSARVLKAEARGLRDDDQVDQQNGAEAQTENPGGDAKTG